MASDTTLDYDLVCREQRLLQTFLDGYRARSDGHWEPIHRELNKLLNQHFVGSLASRLFACSDQYCRVLSQLRRELGVALDFAEQAHRVRIGLALIQHIRQDQMS